MQSCDRLFGGDALLDVTGGTIAMLEPIVLRSTAPRDVFAWKRGKTTATAGQLMGLNGLTAENLVKRAIIVAKWIVSRLRLQPRPLCRPQKNTWIKR